MCDMVSWFILFSQVFTFQELFLFFSIFQVHLAAFLQWIDFHAEPTSCEHVSRSSWPTSLFSDGHPVCILMASLIFLLCQFSYGNQSAEEGCEMQPKFTEQRKRFLERKIIVHVPARTCVFIVMSLGW